MELDGLTKLYSNGFKDKEAALYRLNCIVHFGLDAGVPVKTLQEQLKKLTRLCKLYGDKALRVLRVAERSYADAAVSGSPAVHTPIPFDYALRQTNFSIRDTGRGLFQRRLEELLIAELHRAPVQSGL